MSLTGNLCSIFGSIFVIFCQYFSTGSAEAFIGLGAFCTWASIVKYFSNTGDYYVITRTFKHAVPLIARVWIGILPVYAGIAFLSISVEWAFPESFRSLMPAFYTFFSVQAGDALFDTFVSMKTANYFYGHIFAYLFIFFVVSLVQNIFFIIVEDAYISIKYAKNFEWLSSGYNPAMTLDIPES